MAVTALNFLSVFGGDPSGYTFGQTPLERVITYANT